MNKHETARYLPLTKASEHLGISMYMLRKGVKAGSIPSVMIGGTYYIDMEVYQRQLDEAVMSRSTSGRR